MTQIKAIVRFLLNNYKVYLIPLILNKLPSKLKLQKNKFTVQLLQSYLKSLTH
ncbi:hypothetical protein D3C76_1494750 [compost metagenome]